LALPASLALGRLAAEEPLLVQNPQDPPIFVDGQSRVLAEASSATVAEFAQAPYNRPVRVVQVRGILHAQNDGDVLGTLPRVLSMDGRDLLGTNLRMIQ